MGAGLGFKTFVTGDVLTAADTNGYLMQGVWVFATAAARDAAVTSPQEGNMCFLKDSDTTQYYSGSAWTAVANTPTFVGCSLVKVANQTTSAATYTVIAFTSEDFDTNGFHDNSTNTGRITIPSGYAGKYLITGQLSTADGNETSTSAIKKNGANFNTLTSFRSAQSGAGGSTQSIIMNLAVADYVEIAQYSGSGVQVNGTASNDRPSIFACQWLGA